jgi:hypothetical protein
VQIPEMPGLPRIIPEGQQPAYPEMGRIEGPSSQPYQPPEVIEDHPEVRYPESAETEEALTPEVPWQKPSRDPDRPRRA